MKDMARTLIVAFLLVFASQAHAALRWQCDSEKDCVQLAATRYHVQPINSEFTELWIPTRTGPRRIVLKEWTSLTAIIHRYGGFGNAHGHRRARPIARQRPTAARPAAIAAPVQATRSEIPALRAQIAELRGAVALSKSALAALSEQLTSLNERIAALQKQADEARRAHAKLAQRITAIEWKANAALPIALASALLAFAGIMLLLYSRRQPERDAAASTRLRESATERIRSSSQRVEENAGSAPTDMSVPGEYDIELDTGNRTMTFDLASECLVENRATPPFGLTISRTTIVREESGAHHYRYYGFGEWDFPVADGERGNADLLLIVSDGEYDSSPLVALIAKALGGEATPRAGRIRDFLMRTGRVVKPGEPLMVVSRSSPPQRFPAAA